MTISFDIKIMGVKARISRIRELQRELSLSDSDIVLDDRGDKGGGNPWYNAKRAWFHPGKAGVTHRLVLQDDVILSSDVLSIISKSIKYYPSCAFTFFNRREQTYNISCKSPFIWFKGCYASGQALLLPLRYVSDIASFTDFCLGPDYKHDDCRISWWLAYHGIPLIGLVHSIVQHDVSMKSTLVGHSSKNRNSVDFSQEPNFIEYDFALNDINISDYKMPNLWLDKTKPYFKRANAMRVKAREKQKAMNKDEILERYRLKEHDKSDTE